MTPLRFLPVRAACLLTMAWLGLAPVQAQNLQPVDRIAAVVNEDVILRSELDRAVTNIRNQYAGRSEQLPPPAILERQVLERLIMLRLQVARANDSGIRVNDQELDAAMAQVASHNNMSMEQLRTQLQAEGSSMADFRNSVREELIVQRLRQSFAQSRISVSEAEVDAALDTQTGADATQYRLAHILVSLPENPTPEQISTGESKINGVKALIDRGEMDFAAAAARYSDSQNALDGGDLGWRGMSEIPTAFASVIGSMQPGQVIGPMRGPSGFQLLQLVDTRQADAGTAGTVTQYQARHILIRTGDDVDEAQAKARIDTLHARLAGGADFAELARDSSQDPNTAATGGELGWFTADRYGAEFGNQVAALQDGQLSAPFLSPAGWHIVQRQGSRQRAADEDNRRAQVRESIGQRKLEDDWMRYLREMRGEAYVDIRTAEAAADADTNAGG